MKKTKTLWKFPYLFNDLIAELPFLYCLLHLRNAIPRWRRLNFECYVFADFDKRWVVLDLIGIQGDLLSENPFEEIPGLYRYRQTRREKIGLFETVVDRADTEETLTRELMESQKTPVRHEIPPKKLIMII